MSPCGKKAIALISLPYLTLVLSEKHFHIEYTYLDIQPIDEATYISLYDVTAAATVIKGDHTPLTIHNCCVVFILDLKRATLLYFCSF